MKQHDFDYSRRVGTPTEGLSMPGRIIRDIFGDMPRNNEPKRGSTRGW